MTNTIEKDMFLFVLAYQNHMLSAAGQILHECHLKSMPFDCIYGFDMLELRETCPFQWY